MYRGEGMKPQEEINAALTAGKAQAKTIRENRTLDSYYRDKLAKDAWADTRRQADKAADAALRKALERKRVTDRQLAEQRQAWEDKTDFACLGVAYERVRAKIAAAYEPSEVERFAEEAANDRYLTQALADVGPAAMNDRRMKTNTGPWQSFNPQRVGRVAAERLEAFEPAELKAARTEWVDAWREGRELVRDLDSIKWRYASEGSHLFERLGEKTVHVPTDKGFRIETQNEFAELYQTEEA